MKNTIEFDKSTEIRELSDDENAMVNGAISWKVAAWIVVSPTTYGVYKLYQHIENDAYKNNRHC